jgi:hypothetical protein
MHLGFAFHCYSVKTRRGMLLWPLQEATYLSALFRYTASSPLVLVMMVKSHVFIFLACLLYSTRGWSLPPQGTLLYRLTERFVLKYYRWPAFQTTRASECE